MEKYKKIGHFGQLVCGCYSQQDDFITTELYFGSSTPDHVGGIII